MKKINFRHIKKVDGRFVLTLTREYRAVFGFGERYDGVNMKGKLVKALVGEGGTSYAVPFFLTPDGFGMFVDTYVPVEFDFRADGEFRVTFPEGSGGEEADIWYFEGTPKEILGKFRAVVGVNRVFPKWALGCWMSADRWSTQAEVEYQRNLAHKWNFPHSVLVVENWRGKEGRIFREATASAQGETLSLPDIRFSEPWPDPRALVENLHADGIHVLLGVDCMAEEGETVVSSVAERDDGKLYLDLTDRAGAERVLAGYGYLREIGIDGFRTDGVIVVDETTRFFDGTTGREGRNRYPELASEMFSDLIGKEGIVSTRSGGQRTPTHAVLHVGERESTWAEFAAAIRAGLSAGCSGVCCWGLDIAGGAGYLPGSSLYARAAQAAAFIPVMQWHSSESTCDHAGVWENGDRSPWNLAAYHKDEHLMDIVREQFFLHYNLLPYFYNLLRESGKTGVPAMRHLSLEFPEDEATYGMSDEFMLGEALLVAPVFKEDITTRKVYLPRGRWYDFWTGAIYGGGWHEVKLTENRSPVFMRDNTCVPLNLKDGKICSDVGNRMDGYQELTFLVAGEGRYEFSDDLGNSVVVVWNQREGFVRRNRSGVLFRVLRMGRDKFV